MQTKIKNFPGQAGLHSEAAVADNTTPAHPLEYQPRLSLAIAERITVAGIEKQCAKRPITLRYCRVINPPLMVVIMICRISNTQPGKFVRYKIQLNRINDLCPLQINGFNLIRNRITDINLMAVTGKCKFKTAGCRQGRNIAGNNLYACGNSPVID